MSSKKIVSFPEKSTNKRDRPHCYCTDQSPEKSTHWQGNARRLPLEIRGIKAQLICALMAPIFLVEGSRSAPSTAVTFGFGLAEAFQRGERQADFVIKCVNGMISVEISTARARSWRFSFI